MNLPIQNPPSKPLLVFDGDCRFCRSWIARWRMITGGRVDYEPYQDAAARFPEIPLINFQKSVQLITPENNVYAGAEAVFETLAYSGRQRWWIRFYRRVPGFAFLSERFYGLVAANRSVFSALTRWIWGDELFSGDYFLARSIFIRFIGLIYFIAFASLFVQIVGLFGENGILPVRPFLNAVAEQTGSARYFLLPTVFWFAKGDLALRAVCGIGMGMSIALVAGWAPVPSLAVLWALYLSIFSIGREFLSFQWDILLLEAGFLAVFFAPLQWKMNVGRQRPPSRLILFLFHLLLFKLMFSSGLVKILSGDPSWRTLTAMRFHYETQPLPTWASWFVHQAPLWFQKSSTVAMFVIELAVPFLIFSPRRLRYAAFWALAGLQVSIMATGNYGFFNLLSVALCLLLLDDTFWPRFVRRRLDERRRWSMDFPGAAWPRPLLVGVFSVVIFMNILTVPYRFGLRIPWPSLIVRAGRVFRPLRLANNYGLFAVMTTERREIIVEGSMEGRNWKAYEFKYKPGDPARRPAFVAPHMPRLDWQMWFAALSTARQNPWFVGFCFRLLKGSPEVSALLRTDPFPNGPPRFLRARSVRYRFTTLSEWRTEGTWWKRGEERAYLPPISLNSFR